MKTLAEIKEWTKANNYVFNPKLNGLEEDWLEYDERRSFTAYKLDDVERYRKEYSQWQKQKEAVKKSANYDYWRYGYFDGRVPTPLISWTEGASYYCCGNFEFGGFDYGLELPPILWEHALAVYVQKSKLDLFQCTTLTDKRYKNINKALPLVGFRERARLKTTHEGERYKIIAWERLPFGKEPGEEKAKKPVKKAA